MIVEDLRSALGNTFEMKSLLLVRHILHLWIGNFRDGLADPLRAGDGLNFAYWRCNTLWWLHPPVLKAVLKRGMNQLSKLDEQASSQLTRLRRSELSRRACSTKL